MDKLILDAGAGDPTPSPGLVSVAMCTYNGGRFLAQQMDSLLAQTYQDIEIVVSDDASTDETVAILRRYAQMDSRIRVVANADNVGLTRNFERALRLCRGDYIAPCDQDDIWLPEKIATLIAVLADKQLAYCDSLFVDQSAKPIGSKMSDVVSMVSTDDPVAFAFGNCVSGHAMLFKRDILEFAFPVPEVFFYDWWLAAIAAALGGVVHCDQVLVHYRQHGANVTDTLGARTSTSDQQQRGHRIRYLRETGRRLEALALLPGRESGFIAKLSALWRLREQQWLSPRLGYLMLRERRRFYSIPRIHDKKLVRQCRQFFWGLRTKRLSNRYAYTFA